jgi:hypothetical protein
MAWTMLGSRLASEIEPAEPTIDVKMLHTKIGELTLIYSPGRTRALGISRGSLYYLPRPTSLSDLAVMRRLDELHVYFPFTGTRISWPR